MVTSKGPCPHRAALGLITRILQYEGACCPLQSAAVHGRAWGQPWAPQAVATAGLGDMPPLLVLDRALRLCRKEFLPVEPHLLQHGCWQSGQRRAGPLETCREHTQAKGRAERGQQSRLGATGPGSRSPQHLLWHHCSERWGP